MLKIALFITLVALTQGHEWTRQESAIAENFRFKVVLRNANPEKLEKFFWEVSDPKNEKFGKHLTNEELTEMIALPEEEINSVMTWLKSPTACEVKAELTIHKDYINVQTCFAAAQTLFGGVEFSRYSNTKGQNIIRTTQTFAEHENKEFLSVPAHLHRHIHMIMGVTDLPVRITSTRAELQPFNPDSLVVSPELIRRFYSIPDSAFNFGSVNAANTNGVAAQAVGEFDNAYASPSGLQQFQQHYNIKANPIQKIVGQPDQFGFNGGANTEADLDVQYITSVTRGVDTWYFVMGEFATFVDLTTTVGSTPNAPKVLSVSYEGPEADFSTSLLEQSNTEFKKMGALGFSLIFAAGDSGPGLNQNNCTTFNPKFPSSSPYITSVGGTYIDSNNHEELSWLHSGGGFSNVFSRPSYQDSQVENYLKIATNLPPSNYYNAKGRAYPDVSAFSALFPIVSQGQFEEVGGTSAATPTFASIIALVNIHRHANGKGSLGFLNQTLYGLKGGVGIDIVNGYTDATNRAGFCGNYERGFTTAVGWDPATGLGSPSYTHLASELSNATVNNGNQIEAVAELIQNFLN